MKTGRRIILALAIPLIWSACGERSDADTQDEPPSASGGSSSSGGGQLGGATSTGSGGSDEESLPCLEDLTELALSDESVSRQDIGPPMGGFGGGFGPNGAWCDEPGYTVVEASDDPTVVLRHPTFGDVAEGTLVRLYSDDNDCETSYVVHHALFFDVGEGWEPGPTYLRRGPIGDGAPHDFWGADFDQSGTLFIAWGEDYEGIGGSVWAYRDAQWRMFGDFPTVGGAPWRSPEAFLDGDPRGPFAQPDGSLVMLMKWPCVAIDCPLTPHVMVDPELWVPPDENWISTEDEWPPARLVDGGTVDFIEGTAYLDSQRALVLRNAEGDSYSLDGTTLVPREICEP